VGGQSARFTALTQNAVQAAVFQRTPLDFDGYQAQDEFTGGSR
jgi:hypothetical protein